MSEAARTHPARPVQVTIANGRLEGLQLDGHQAFLGIPFASRRSDRGASARRKPPESWSRRARGKRVRKLGRAGHEPDAGHRRERATRRGLPVPERVHARGGWREASGIFLDPRRRLHVGFGLGAAVRRCAARDARRCGRGDHPLPPRRARLPLPRRPRRRRMGCHRQRGSARPDRRARVGEGEHRGVRRRSRERDDRRRIGGLDGLCDVARHASRTRTLPPRHSAKRRSQPDRRCGIPD